MALGIRKFSGTGSPEGVVPGPPGAVYIQTNASAGSEIWDKATGVGNTGWRLRPSSAGGSQATETVAGIAELATQTETDTGTDDARIVTPAKLRGNFGTTSTKIAAGDRGLPTGGTTGQVLAKNSATNYEVGWVTGGGGFTPGWVNQSTNAHFAAWGDGNPNDALQILDDLGVTVTLTNIGTSVARIVSFSLPKNLSVTAVRAWNDTTSPSTDLVRYCIYRASDGAQIWYPGANMYGATPADDWVTMTGGTPFSLGAGVKYYMCIAVTGPSTNPYPRVGPPPLNSKYYLADAAPMGGRNIGIAAQAQIAVASGAFPATMPAIAAASYTVGGGPICFLEGTAS